MKLEVKIDNLLINNKNILKNINFDLNSPEIMFLNGKSGSGKTTIFKILTKEISEYKGKIILNNKDIRNYEFDEYSQIISYLPQEYTLFKNINLFDQCIEPAIIKGYSRKNIIEECKFLMEEFSIYDKKNCFPNELSGGQKQRIAIIKVLLCKNELIVLDEPTSALDRYNSEILFCKIKDMQKNNFSSFIISSHDINFISKFSNTIQLKLEQK